MADTWRSISVDDVQPGDRIRHREQEIHGRTGRLTVLGMDTMVCFIEDTPTRWHAHPAARAQEVEITGR